MMDDSVNRLDKIKSNYVNSLQQKQEDIRQQLVKLNDSEWSDANAVKALSEIIHKLSGSAGSYDFDELSAMAMEIDSQLKNRIAGNEEEQTITAKVEQLLDTMEQIYQSAKLTIQGTS